MSIVYYPAVVEREERGFGVFFPDLPGCVSAGATIQEAALAAEEALSDHLLALFASSAALPTPTNLDALKPDRRVDEITHLLVRGEHPDRTIDVRIAIDEDLLARIDRIAPGRSLFFSGAARSALANLGLS